MENQAEQRKSSLFSGLIKATLFALSLHLGFPVFHLLVVLASLCLFCNCGWSDPFSEVDNPRAGHTHSRPSLCTGGFFWLTGMLSRESVGQEGNGVPYEQPDI